MRGRSVLSVIRQCNVTPPSPPLPSLLLPDEAEPLAVLVSPPGVAGTQVVRPGLVVGEDGAGGGDADSPLSGPVRDRAPLDTSVTGLGALRPGGGQVRVGGLQVEHEQQGERLEIVRP